MTVREDEPARITWQHEYQETPVSLLSGPDGPVIVTDL